MTAADPSGWRLAPGVRRLRDGRLLGGAPTRVIRLGDTGERVLAGLLDNMFPADVELPADVALPADIGPGRRLTDRLLGYGMLVAPIPVAGSLDDVTVVMPARTTAAQIELRELPADVPVVIVDDGSEAPLREGLAPRVGLTLLRHETPRGPAAARNAGAAVAGTRWIAFIDADVRWGADSLRRLLSETRVAGDVVAVGPRIRNLVSPGVAGLLETHAGALDLGATECDVGPGRRVSYLSTACLMVERETFLRIGGFDEDMQVAEDVDLIWRLVAQGRVRYQPAVEVGHAARATVSDVLRRRHFYGTGAAALELRHPGNVRHADVSVWSLVAWTVALVLDPAIGLAVATAVAGVAPRRIHELPAGEALRLAVRGEWADALGLCQWLLRPLWPVTLLLAIALPTRRRALVGACVLGLVGQTTAEWRTDDRPGSVTIAVSGLLAHFVTDLAYSAGVWQGCLRQRRLAPLLPRVRGLDGVRRNGVRPNSRRADR